MIDNHYIQAQKKFKGSGEICTEHVWDHYIGRQSFKYVAVCLNCSEVWGKYLQEKREEA